MLSNNPNIPLNTGSEFNLKEFIYKYIRYLPLIIACILIALVMGFVRIRYTTPQYNVGGKLLINKDAKGTGGQGLEDMYMFSNNVNLKNEVEILQSRQLAKRVVKSLDLQISYFNKGTVRSSNIYRDSPIEIEIISLKDSQRYFALEIAARDENFSIGENSIQMPYNQMFETANGLFKIKRVIGKSLNTFSSNIYTIIYQPIGDATANLAGSIKAFQNIDQATILDISMETDNIKLGMDVVNTTMKEYGKMNVEDKREISKATMQFIDERLDSIKNELGGVENNILSYREKNNVIDLDQQSHLYYSEMEGNKKELIEQEVQNGVLDYLSNYISNPDHQFHMVPTNLGIQEPVLLPLISQYNNLQLQRYNLLATTGPANKTVEAAERELGKLKDQIIEALKNVKAAYKINADKITQQLNKNLSDWKRVPSKAKGLLDIERQQKIKQELYLFLLQKREEAAISVAATVSSSKPLEDATGSSAPIKPNKRSIYVIAFVFGTLIPVAIIALLEFLNDKITHKEEITKTLQIPIVGEIGHATGETLVVQTASRKIIAEQFRIMRTNVQYLISKKEKPVMLITSSMSGEGKSFIATNFGAVMALAGKKTIVLEFDIRKPRLLKGLNLRTESGLINYIMGTASLSDIIIPVPEFNNLFVIGCGPVPPNPSEILLDSQVEKLFAELKQKFDLIVIDTAPVGLVSDAYTLSAFADASIYIVRQGYTLKKQLNSIEEIYQKKRLPNMGLLINDIKSSGRYRGYYGYSGAYGNFGYGGYGSYGYAHSGDYFEKQESKKKWWRKWFKK